MPATVATTYLGAIRRSLGCGLCADVAALWFFELPPQVRGDGTHAVDAGCGFRGGVVIGIGVDVVGVHFPARIGDELDAGDANAIVGNETPVALDDRVREIADNLESRRRPARWCLTRRAESIVDLAHVPGAQLEAARGADPYRIEKSAADELDAGNVRLRCADVVLDQRNAGDRISDRR